MNTLVDTLCRCPRSPAQSARGWYSRRFVTNSTRLTRGAIINRLARMGLEVSPSICSPRRSRRNHIDRSETTPHLLVHADVGASSPTCWADRPARFCSATPARLSVTRRSTGASGCCWTVCRCCRWVPTAIFRETVN